MAPPFLPDPDAHRLREKCWGCSTAHAVLVVARDDETIIMGGLWRWRWRYSRAVHQDCLARDKSATLGWHHGDCPLFPPARLA